VKAGAPAVANPSPLASALAYLSRGFEPVALRGPADGGKAPIALDWQRGDITMDTLARDFGGAASRNIGLRMGGPRRLIALDIDGADGRASIAAMEAEHGALPATMSSRSGRPDGGAHMVFWVPADLDIAAIKNAVKFRPGLDVRAQGGQIVVEPSMHASGAAYEWTDSRPPARMPVWLYLAMVAGRRAADAPARAGVPRPRIETDDDRASKRASAYLAALPASIQGADGSGALWAAALGLVRGFDLRPDVALELLASEFNPRCTPPWSEGELRHKVADASKSPLAPGYIRDADDGDAGMRKAPRTRGRTGATAGLVTDNENENEDTMGEAANDTTVIRMREVSPRPDIEISTDLGGNIDDGSAALARSSDLYERDHTLVQVLRDARNKRDSRAPVAKRIQPPTLRKMLAVSARWLKYNERKKALVECLPTDHITQGVFHEGQWPGVRSLIGVLETPFLRPDGSVCQKRGYDGGTGYLLETSETFPAVPAHPTREDAKKALRFIVDEAFADFPFVSEAARFVPVADALTVLAKPALGDGNVPMTVYDATTAGTGKTLAAEVVCLITMGRVIPKTPYPNDPAELEKFLGAVAREASPIVFFDNATSAVGGGYLDAALTANGVVKFRILGVSETATSAWIAKVIVTGNNVALKGDTPRRALICRQETDLERPETREGFKHADLLGWVKEHRGELVVALLTVLRAYHLAGQPDVEGVKPLGSFAAWSKLVAGAIVWAGGANVLETIASDGRDTEEVSALRTLLARWPDLCRTYGPEGMTAARALESLYPKLNPREPPMDDGWGGLRGAIETLCHCSAGGRPTTQAIAKRLAMYRGRVLGGRRLRERVVHKTGLWWVETVSAVRPSAPAENGVPEVGGGARGAKGALFNQGPGFAEKRESHAKAGVGLEYPPLAPLAPPFAPPGGVESKSDNPPIAPRFGGEVLPFAPRDRGRV